MVVVPLVGSVVVLVVVSVVVLTVVFLVVDSIVGSGRQPPRKGFTKYSSLQVQMALLPKARQVAP